MLVCIIGDKYDLYIYIYIAEYFDVNYVYIYKSAIIIRIINTFYKKVYIKPLVYLCKY